MTREPLEGSMESYRRVVLLTRQSQWPLNGNEASGSSQLLLSLLESLSLLLHSRSLVQPVCNRVRRD